MFRESQIEISDHVKVRNAWAEAHIIETDVFFCLSDIVFPRERSKVRRYLAEDTIARFDLCSTTGRSRMVVAANVQLTRLRVKADKLFDHTTPAGVLLKCTGAKEVLVDG